MTKGLLARALYRSNEIKMSGAVEFAKIVTPKQDSIPAVNSYKKKFANEIKSDPYSILLRSSYGSAGVNTKVGVNYFKYNVTGLKLYSYRVELEIGSNVKTRLTTKQAVERYLFDLEPFKSKRSQIYYRDFNNMYSSIPLPIEDVVVYPIEITVSGEKKTVHLKVKFIKVLNFNDLINYTQLKKYTTDFQETAEYTNALVSVIGSQVLQNNHVVGIGSNKFFLIDKSTKKHELEKGLYLVMGTFASVRCSFDNIQVNLNPTPAIFYKSVKSNGDQMNVLDLIAEFLNLKGLPTERDIRKSEQFMKGVKIRRQYLPKASAKAILGFNFKDNSETLKFRDSDDKLVTVKQYFKQRWSISLKYPKLPLIKISLEAYLPMELGLIMPNQQYKGELADPAKIIKITASRPMERAKLIALANSNLFQKQVDFGTIDQKFTVVPARVLSAPTIEYAKNQKVTYRDVPANGKNETKKGNWNLENFQFVEPARAKQYLFGICLLKDGSVTKEKIGAFSSAVPLFLSELGRLGIPIRKSNNGHDFRKYSVDLQHESVKTQAGLEATLTSIFKKAKSQDKCDYLLVLLPRSDTTYYLSVKRVCDLKVGILNSCSILSVFIKQRRGSFDTMTYAQMAMKVNIKLGGSNHKLSHQDSASLVDKNGVPIMILGADVTHPTGQINHESVSIASCVASEDGIFNKFPGSIRIQSGGQEVIKDIKGMVLERLENFHNKVKKLPSRVLFYRDGVSEGQYYTVLKEELSKIKAAFAEYGRSKKVPKYSPTITFMIVVKRHHTRFIPLEKNAKDPRTNKVVAVQSYENVIPGTTVDRDITSQAYFDFYIQSQQALQGTGVPAHYYVLHDENNYTSDQIQRITYNLCHTFSRATKSVKIVPAAYYADLLCTRGRDYIYGFAKDTTLGSSPIERANAKLGDGIAPNIRNTMFYI